MTTQEKLDHIMAIVDDMKAEGIESIDVHEKTSMAEFFVICSGTSDRHVQSIADKVLEKMTEMKEKPLRTEGDRSGWVLHDYGDVWLHVMRDEQRQFYDLESFWKHMRPSYNIPQDEN